MDIKEALSKYHKDIDLVKQELNLTDGEIIKELLNFIDIKEDLVLNKVTFETEEKRRILNEISFRIKPGTFHVFVGNNGAGKSTTMKCMVGLNNQYNGSINFGDTDELDRSKLFFVPDKHNKLPTNIKTKDYMIQIIKLLTNIDPLKMNEQIEEYAEKFGFINELNKNINKLSTGEKQKAMIACALIVNPPFIILDEPFGNLDPSARYIIMDELKVATTKGTAIFLSTHLLEEVESYATHVTFIKKGNIILSGEIKDTKSIVNFYKKEYMGQ